MRMSMSISIACGAFVSCVFTGCSSGVDVPRCRGNWDDDMCFDAYVLAGRVSDVVLTAPSAAEVLVEELAAAKTVACESIAARAVPNTGGLTAAVVYTSDPSVTAAWSRGLIHTGVVAVDDLFEGNGAYSVVGTTNPPWEIRFSRPIGHAALASLAATAGVQVAGGLADDGPNITRMIDNGASVYHLEVGWGDCSAGCTGVHFWEVRVDGETAIKQSEGGDDIPQFFHDTVCAS
jgi:hypothetical protein